MLRKIIICLFLMLIVIGNSQWNVGLDNIAEQSRFVPKLINYQGYLTDTLGVPINDTINMTFSIYDNITAGNIWWSETQTNIPIEQGIFSVILGNNNTIPDSVFVDGTDRWLELVLEGPDTLSPRTRMTSAGYAYMATYSDTAEYARNAIADNDWVRGTPDSVLFTVDYLGLARGDAFNELLGDAHRQINFGVSCTTGNGGAGSADIAILSGWGCKADSAYGTIVNGVQNKARGQMCFIGSGWSNLALGQASAIVGGEENNTTGYRSFIGGGFSNVAGDFSDDTSAVVVGGWDNSATTKFSFIGGGQANSVSASHATLCGGKNNTITGNYASIIGGDINTANSMYSTIAGGRDNYTSGEYASVIGGFQNRTNANYATIGGGYRNYVDGIYSAIFGGYADTIFSTADYSYLFGIRAKCTEDSTFMVDMPHIWFGDEVNGYEFPVDDGSTNQVMATDGSGQLSWTDVEDSDWIISSNDMYSAVSGNIGIGTMTPGKKLTLADSTDEFALRLERPDDTYAQIFEFVTGGNRDWYIYEGSGDQDLHISRDVGSSGDILIAPTGGNVGIGTAIPREKLHVAGDDTLGRLLISSVSTGVDDDAELILAEDVNNTYNMSLRYDGGTNELYVYGRAGATVYGPHLTIERAGDVGINKINPSYALDIEGTAAMTGFRLTTGASSGYVLTSNASGTGTWQPVGSDNDWVRGTPDSVLFTANLLGLARGGANNEMYGEVEHQVNFGRACTTGTDGFANGGDIAVLSGFGNHADSSYGTVMNGISNKAQGQITFIGNGRYNEANGQKSFIGCGEDNVVDAYCGFVGGGYNNESGDAYSDTAVVITGGWDNSAIARYTFIGGGQANSATGNHCVVVGGMDNTASVLRSFVGGGENNSASADRSSVCGGLDNNADGWYAFIGGGRADTVISRHGGILSGYSNLAGNESGDSAVVVVGGWDNTATADFAFIGGGYSNDVNNIYTFLGGGRNNACTGEYTAVVGGYNNSSNGNRCFIGGGYSNETNYDYSVIAGGYNNTADTSYTFIGGGSSNTARGYRSVIGGGYSNETNYSYSVIAGGYNNTADTSYVFIGCGASNIVSGYRSAIGGGYSNYVSGNYAFIGGGYVDTVEAHLGAVLAGYNNLAGNGAGDSAAVVVGGMNNSVTAKFSFIGGGLDNTVPNSYSVVCGGRENRANAGYTTIAGGYENYTSFQYAAVLSGYADSATQYGAVICGGTNNKASASRSFIGGGHSNEVSADFATIPGGYNNIADGYCSFSFGRNAYTNGYDSVAVFNWGTGYGTFFIGQNASATAYRLYVNGSAYCTGSWATSDQEFKTNVHSILNPLDLVKQLNPVHFQWKHGYKEYGIEGGRDDYGFIAQEIQNVLPEVVGEGATEDHLAVNYDHITAVNTAAIQELTSLVEDLQKENAELKKRLEILERKSSF